VLAPAQQPRGHTRRAAASRAWRSSGGRARARCEAAASVRPRGESAGRQRGVSVPVRGGRRVRRARGSDLHGHRGPGRAACGGPGRPEQAAAGARATGLGSGVLWGCLRALDWAAGLRAQESALQNALGGRWA